MTISSMLYVALKLKFNYNLLCQRPDMAAAVEAHINVSVVFYILKCGAPGLQHTTAKEG